MHEKSGSAYCTFGLCWVKRESIGGHPEISKVKACLK